MPHSETPEPVAASNGGDETMADTPAEDVDIKMAEPSSPPAPAPAANGDEAKKKDVKLEDLFADMDSDPDDEFSSSRPKRETTNSSSPDATPSSPMSAYLPPA